MEVEDDERAWDGGEGGGKQQRQEIHFAGGGGGQLGCQRDPGPPAERPTIRRGCCSLLPFRRPKGSKKKKTTTTTTTMEKGKWHAKATKNFGR